MANDLNFGGQVLNQQLKDSEAEERRKRMLGLSATGRGNIPPILSPATLSLFGGMGGYGR
jgi:hypothetical protein